jgi:hypothetical protein
MGMGSMLRMGEALSMPPSIDAHPLLAHEGPIMTFAVGFSPLSSLLGEGGLGSLAVGCAIKA